MPESWLPVAGVAGLVLVVLLVGMAIAKRYRVARPNEAFIVTGRKGKTSNDLSGQKVVTGGGVFVLPFVQQLSVLDMSSRRITVEVNGAPSSQGIALNVSGVAIVKVHNEDVSIRAAAQRFGSQQEEIDSFTTNQLSGALRAIVGNLTVEQVIRDRESFSQQVLESVTGSLSAQGLSLDAFTIQEVGDHGGGSYILDMGRASAAAIRREAEIAEAEARRLSEEKRIHSETEVANYQRALDLRQAEILAETDRAKALSASAGPLEAAARQQEILAQEELVAERQAALTERQLDTTVRRPADAERYRLEQQAEAQRVTAVKAAEASKAENELRGAGELALRSAQARATELEGAARGRCGPRPRQGRRRGAAEAGRGVQGVQPGGRVRPAAGDPPGDREAARRAHGQHRHPHGRLDGRRVGAAQGRRGQLPAAPGADQVDHRAGPDADRAPADGLLHAWSCRRSRYRRPTGHRPPRSDAYARPHDRAHPEQRRALGRPGCAGHGVRPRVRVRPEHVAVRRARVRGDPPGGPVRPRRRGRLRPGRLRPAAVRLPGRVRGRRGADPGRARPGPGGVRRALGERDDRRPRGGAPAGAVRPAGARRTQPAVRRRRCGYRGGFSRRRSTSCWRPWTTTTWAGPRSSRR